MVVVPSAEPPTQMTPDLKEELQRYAEGRAKLVCRAGKPVPDSYARELVDDVHADFCVGALPPWDPQCELINHLKAAIRRRTWLEIRHARRIPFVSLPEAAEAAEAANDETEQPELEQSLESAPRTGCDPAQLYEITVAVCRQLRTLALDSGDAGAAAIVKCWADGFMAKDEIKRLAGLTEVAYMRARRRLRRAIRNRRAIESLTPELRKAAQDLLRSAA